MVPEINGFVTRTKPWRERGSSSIDFSRSIVRLRKGPKQVWTNRYCSLTGFLCRIFLESSPESENLHSKQPTDFTRVEGPYRSPNSLKGKEEKGQIKRRNMFFPYKIKEKKAITFQSCPEPMTLCIATYLVFFLILCIRVLSSQQNSRGEIIFN